MAKIILQPSRIGMTFPMAVSKINFLSDFFIRIVKDYNLEVMNSIQFNGQMISMDFIHNKIKEDESLKEQVKQLYNPKIQPLGDTSPWNKLGCSSNPALWASSSLKTFLEQPDFNFQERDIHVQRILFFHQQVQLEFQALNIFF